MSLVAVTATNFDVPYLKLKIMFPLKTKTHFKTVFKLNPRYINPHKK